MWDKAVLFVFFVAVTYIFKNIASSEPNKIKFNFNFLLYYFLGSTVAVVLLPYFLLNPRDVGNARFAAGILKHITKIYGIKWELRKGEILSESRGAVIVSNHQSSLDILGLFNIWATVDRIACIARKEVFYVLPFGLAAYLAGTVFIDRRNPKDAYKQLQITSNVMVNEKTKLWLFPEGTRNKNFTKLLPFKKGAFTMAVAAQVPVIPVVFSPYYFINKKRNIFNKGHVIIQCLEPISTVGLKSDDVPELVQRVRSVMEDAYQKLSKEVLSALPSDYPLAPLE